MSSHHHPVVTVSFIKMIILCDVIKDPVSCFLVLQPLADEDAGGGRVVLPAAQHAVAVSHAVLEGPVVDLTTGIPEVKHRRSLSQDARPDLRLSANEKLITAYGPNKDTLHCHQSSS